MGVYGCFTKCAERLAIVYSLWFDNDPQTKNIPGRDFIRATSMTAGDEESRGDTEYRGQIIGAYGYKSLPIALRLL